jgi:hypothetical protein
MRQAFTRLSNTTFSSVRANVGCCHSLKRLPLRAFACAADGADADHGSCLAVDVRH